MKIRTSDYRAGDLVGSHGMQMLARLPFEPGVKPKATFVCGRCGATTRPIQVYDVARGATVSCGCRQRETGKENFAKMPPEVLKAIRRASGLATISKLLAHQNTAKARRANIAKMPREAKVAGARKAGKISGPKTSRANAVAMNAHPNTVAARKRKKAE